MSPKSQKKFKTQLVYTISSPIIIIRIVIIIHVSPTHSNTTTTTNNSNYEIKHIAIDLRFGIMITCPCNVHPLTPHFYVVNGYTFFLTFAPKHRSCVHIRTALMGRF